MRQSIFLPEHKLEELLNNLGIVINGDTGSDFICYCPFHSNRDSPAFNISKSANHLWRCHNGSCGKKGNVVSLLTLKGYSYKEAAKMLAMGVMEISDLEKFIKNILFPVDKSGNAEKDWAEVDPVRFVEANEEAGYPATEYMNQRGVSTEAMQHFGIGYSPAKHMAVIPVFNEKSNLVGVIGREIAKKRYQYSSGLSRGELIWNIHNAMSHESIILTEGSIDSIYLWQAGYPNVGAVLGSSISPKQWDQLRKYFSEIICFFDNDDAGNTLAAQVMEEATDLSICAVEYPDRVVEYMSEDGEEKTRPIKDPGDMTAAEIAYAIDNRKNSIDFLLEGL